MRPSGGGFAAAILPAGRRARLRGRPSGLKGRCRDRCATGLRPALDPGASTAPPTQWHGQEQRPLPAQPRGARLIQDQIPLHNVSTLSGDCHRQQVLAFQERLKLHMPAVGARHQAPS